MKTPKILFIQGGWDGHQPEQIVHQFDSALINRGWKTESITSLECLAEADYTLRGTHLHDAGGMDKTLGQGPGLLLGTWTRSR
jgi:hypothetical protein